MTIQASDALPRVIEQVRALHQDVDQERLTFSHWVPRSERKQRQRLFVASVLDGTPHYVAKVSLDDEDQMVAREWQMLTDLHGSSISVPDPVQPLERGFAMANVGMHDLPDVLAGADHAEWSRLLLEGVEAGATVHLREVPLLREGAAHRFVGAAASMYPGETREALSHAGVGAVHGDMGPWNFRVCADGAVALIDWEDFSPRGICALDVLNLVLTAALIAYPEYRERGFDWLFDKLYQGEGPYQDAARAALARYADLTGESPSTVLALTPVFCDAMVRRIRAQGRPVDHLFFLPLAARYRADPLRQIGGRGA
ncbi:hypothetical protein ACFWGN_03220 [Oerskovia sp. NPDC060338]|uniref:hypothetical protein n=1 Tax=Oerskovia sp. NPDC060338 TaxID=3347100 RepID=UPI0036676A73